MNARFPATATLLVLSLGALARPRPAQDDAAAQSEMKKQFLALSARNGPPAAEHGALEAFVGRFDLRSSVNMGPGRTMRVHGSAEGKAVIDGRFVEVLAVSAPDEELHGERRNYFGWDPAAKQYTLWGIESRNDLAYSARGGYDEAQATFTFEGELPQVDGSATPFRWVMHVGDDGSIDQAIDVRPPGASGWVHVVDVHYERET